MNNLSEEKTQKVFKIKFRTVYGNRLIYPMNDTSRAFARLMDKKTFKSWDLDIIKSLGFEVQIAQDVL